MLIERRRRGGSEATQAPHGITLEIQAPFFEEELALHKQQAERGGLKRLFVRDWLFASRGSGPASGLGAWPRLRLLKARPFPPVGLKQPCNTPQR